ncbi:MAG: 4-hydroxy-tetrahydrodipicolinate synthase [Oscillospiraceae bacterium]|nr:4-hydroxy-tetrahydrodipicolinate synthase [Oscillospiraceae bacterium]MDY3791199.1 4-hydroxy-tetrahydrodipicolinate synthase [Oscillospiraceae bacterium]MDY6209113.1 4-hydroxy-tetrahydrodipicolinate synthase [Oscillospiraceae bacterium]
MKNTIFTGAGVAIVTPMNADGSVNYAALGELIEMQIAGGTDAIIICGTTGESSTLTDDEHRECIRYTIEKVNKRVPVIAGTGSNDTAYAIELSKDAEEMGADGLLLVTPYYNKTSQRGLVAHYTAIADAVNIPIILYNVPSRTGVNISLDTYKILAEHKNIAAAKEASGNISAIAKLIAECGDKLDVYSGNDDQIVPIMALGGKGVISVLSNVAPKQTHEIAQLCLENNCAEAAKMAAKYLHLANSLFIDVNPIPVKEALNMMGIAVGSCRLPLYEMEDSKKETLASALREAGLIK